MKNNIYVTILLIGVVSLSCFAMRKRTHSDVKAGEKWDKYFKEQDRKFWGEQITEDDNYTADTIWKKLDFSKFVKANNTKGVKAVLDQGNIDIDIRLNGPNSHTPLGVAIQEEAWDVAKLLIESEANVNAKQPIDTTPLAMAALGENSEVVDLLIKAGAEVNENITWLMPVIEQAKKSNESREVLKVLLRAGADLPVDLDDLNKPNLSKIDRVIQWTKKLLNRN